MCRHYVLLLSKVRKFESLNSYSCKFRVRLTHLIAMMSFVLGHASIHTRRTFSSLFLFYEYDSSVLQNVKILQLFLDCPLYSFPYVVSSDYLTRCVLITLHIRLDFSDLQFVVSDTNSRIG